MKPNDLDNSQLSDTSPPNTPDYRHATGGSTSGYNLTIPENARRNAMLSISGLFAIVIACVCIVIYLANQTVDVPPIPPVPGGPQIVRTNHGAVFDSEVQPALAEVAKRNQVAAENCCKRISELFDQYSEGIDPFTTDMMSWGSRWKTLKNMTWDWWNTQTSSQQFVEQKFQQHLFSEKKLTADLEAILRAFRDEVRANQKNLLTEIRANISKSGMPDLTIPDYSLFAAGVERDLTNSFGNAAEKSLISGITVFVVSEVGSIALSQIVVQLLARIGTAAASTSVTGATAMAGSATVGGGTGALGGPIGIAVGVGVGIVAGIIIDAWMSNSFKTKLRTSLQQYLNELKNGILQGNSNGPGLAVELPRVCDSLTESYRTSLFNSIVNGDAHHVSK